MSLDTAPLFSKNIKNTNISSTQSSRTREHWEALQVKKLSVAFFVKEVKYFIRHFISFTEVSDCWKVPKTCHEYLRHFLTMKTLLDVDTYFTQKINMPAIKKNIKYNTKIKNQQNLS